MREITSFIGGGNMAASLIGGLLASGREAAAIRVAVRSESSADGVRRRFGVQSGTDIRAAIDGAATVVLAVKPQQMAEAVGGLRVAAGTTVLSVAAGVYLATLRQWLDTDAVVRAMPNTPALFRCGVSGLYAEPALEPIHRSRAEGVLQAVGSICWLRSEAEIDAVTALSGCGPAYYFLLTEVLREAGTALGLEPAVAARLAQDTFVGAALMARDAATDVAQLRREVTSKGGSTEAAVASLEAAGLRRIFAEALAAANARSRSRSEELAELARSASLSKV